MNTLLQSEFCGRLCWALAHSLWQAAAVAIVAIAITFVLRHRSASVRYNVYLAALLLSLATFPVTLAMLGPSRSEVAPNTSAAVPEVVVTAPPLAAATQRSSKLP